MANTSKRGFASMDTAKQREIASKGGKAAHAKGTAHEFTSDEARVAGRKGGEAVSRDRAHMSAIGREGGHSRGARARASQSGTSSSTSTSSTRTSSASNPNYTRPSITERSSAGAGLEGRTGSIGNSSSGSERSWAASDRDRDRNRSERSGDNLSTNSPFSGRDEI
jgi:general stress protein YciG